MPFSNVNKEESGKERALKKWNKRSQRIQDKRDFQKWGHCDDQPISSASEWHPQIFFRISTISLFSFVVNCVLRVE